MLSDKALYARQYYFSLQTVRIFKHMISPVFSLQSVYSVCEFIAHYLNLYIWSHMKQFSWNLIFFHAINQHILSTELSRHEREKSSFENKSKYFPASNMYGKVVQLISMQWISFLAHHSKSHKFITVNLTSTPLLVLYLFYIKSHLQCYNSKVVQFKGHFNFIHFHKGV